MRRSGGNKVACYLKTNTFKPDTKRQIQSNGPQNPTRHSSRMFSGSNGREGEVTPEKRCSPWRIPCSWEWDERVVTGKLPLKRKQRRVRRQKKKTKRCSPPNNSSSKDTNCSCGK